MLTKEQLDGLHEVLPAGYPKECGVIDLTTDPCKKASRKTSRRLRKKKAELVPWYQRTTERWEF